MTVTRYYEMMYSLAKGNNMKAATKMVRIEKGEYQVVDTRNEMILKRNVKTAAKAAAYVDFYNQEIEKAEKLWS